MTDGLNFSDIEALAQAVLDDVDSDTKMPKVVSTKLPMRVVQRVGGAAIDARWLDGPLVHVISLAATDAAAKALAREAGRRLFAASRNQTVFTDLGWIHTVTETAGPIRYLGTVPDGVSRFDATYRIDHRTP